MNRATPETRNCLGPFRSKNGGSVCFSFNRLGDLKDICGDATVEQVAQIKQEWGLPSGKLMWLDSIERRGSQTVYGDAFCIDGQVFPNMWRTTLGLPTKLADLEQLAQKAVQKLELREKEIVSGPPQPTALVAEVNTLSKEVRRMGESQKSEERKERQLTQLKTELHNERQKNVKQHPEGRTKGQNLLTQIKRILRDIKRRPRGRRNPTKPQASACKNRMCYACRSK